MKMEKRKFRIGELADQLNVERFVIRFWEKEFNLSTTRSLGGQRFYNENDLELFSSIKTLLHHKGFTIAGAKKELKFIALKKKDTIIASKKTTIDLTQKEKNSALSKKIKKLKDKLQELRKLL